MHRIGLALGLAALSCACQTHPIYDHPQNAQVQEQVRKVIDQLRTSTGDALYLQLRELAAFDVFAVDQVIHLAKDPNSKLRSNAMWVLGQIRDPRFSDFESKIVRALRRGVSDHDRMVRYEAASSLLFRNDWTVIPLLIEGLEDPEPGVGHNCNEVLTQVTNRNFGFDINQNPSDRQLAVARWREWYAGWKKHEG